MGASVLLLRRLLLFVGTRRLDAAEGGGMRELPVVGRGGWRVFVGGPRFGCGVCRGRGAAGGGIRALVFALVVERVGGRSDCDEGGVRDGGGGDLVVPEARSLRLIVCDTGCSLAPFIFC